MDLLEFDEGELAHEKFRFRHDIILDPLNLDYEVSINLGTCN